MASFNTIAGCVLASALFAMVVGKVSNAVVHPHKLDKPALAVSDDAPTQTAAAPAAIEIPPIGPKLAGANVDAGKALFQKQCFSCHTVDKGGANKVGPHLFGVYGRNEGSVEGFGYSAAMKGRNDKNWDADALDHFLKNPKAYVPGTAMAFAGISKPETRADVVAYLNSLADAPQPLPKP